MALPKTATAITQAYNRTAALGFRKYDPNVEWSIEWVRRRNGVSAGESE